MCNTCGCRAGKKSKAKPKKSTKKAGKKNKRYIVIARPAKQAVAISFGGCNPAMNCGAKYLFAVGGFNHLANY